MVKVVKYLGGNISKGKANISCALALALFVMSFCSICQAAEFSIEEESLKPAPDNIVELILNKEKDSEWRKCKFIGKQIDLKGQGRAEDYVVTTAGACMCGAAICPIWALRKIGKSYVLVVSDGGYTMKILKQKHNGLADLSFEAATAGWSQKRLWRFDGKRYVRIKKKAKKDSK
jgi:hypothetical protein